MKINSSAKHPNLIVRYVHCSFCFNEGKRPSIEAGITPDGLQVWCRNHNCNIAHFELGPMKIPGCSLCEAGVPHTH